MIQIVLIGLSLSLDAFCIAVTNGLTYGGSKYKLALLLGLYFGGFQFLMPLIGSTLTGAFAHYIGGLGSVISFILLAFLGIRMIISATKASPDSEPAPPKTLSHAVILSMAVATSIDALAVGVTFTFMDIELLPACIIIGVITFVISALGTLLGQMIPAKSGKYAEIAGGCVLIGIGLRIILESLFF